MNAMKWRVCSFFCCLTPSHDIVQSMRCPHSFSQFIDLHMISVDGWFSAAMWDPVMPQRALTMSISLLCFLVDESSASETRIWELQLTAVFRKSVRPVLAQDTFVISHPLSWGQWCSCGIRLSTWLVSESNEGYIECLGSERMYVWSSFYMHWKLIPNDSDNKRDVLIRTIRMFQEFSGILPW